MLDTRVSALMKLTYHPTLDFIFLYQASDRVGVFDIDWGHCSGLRSNAPRIGTRSPPTSRLSCFDVGPQQEGLGKVPGRQQGSSDNIAGELDNRTMPRS
jgi:hypothetical protein